MTALIGDFMVGVQSLWPVPPVSVSDIFDLPSWERPTSDTPYRAPLPDETFTGSPVFTGGDGTDFEGAPGFDGAPTDGSFWVIGDVSDDRDGGTIGVVSDGGVTLIPIYAHRLRFWRVEVRDDAGDLVSHVPQLITGKLSRKLDQASQLEFRVAYDAEGAADLVRPNYIVLRDRWGFVVDTFQIQQRRPVGSGEGSYLDVMAQGRISQLADEVVLQYEGDTAGITVGDHVSALMALQQKAGPFEVGTIDPEIADIEMPFYAADTSIHAALLQLQLALPKEYRGRFYLDARGLLQWRMAPGDITEQVITRGRNVRGISAETDYTTLVNRIYLYGEGQDIRDRLKLTDGGEAEEYLEDTDSVATWGLSPAIKVDRRVRYPETLIRIANRILEEYAQPQVSVEVDLLDLAKADNFNGWRDIEIGGKYRVVDTALEVDTVVEIVGLEVDFSRPVPLRVELANQKKSLGDLISSLVDALEQPLDVDGNRYPTMGRNYSDREPREARKGDTRWNDGSSRGQMHDGADWQDMGGGIPLYQATSKAGLDNTDIEPYALGFITSGPTAGAWYERNAGNTDWVGRTIWEVPA